VLPTRSAYCSHNVRPIKNNMRLPLTGLALFCLPAMACANPVSLNGQSMIAFGVVAFWALVIESGVATLTLLSTGIAIVPSFIFLATTNIAVFAFCFVPMSDHASLWILEPGVVVVDAICIKTLTGTVLLQGPNYLEVTWRRAFVASFLGNTTSFFVGVIATHGPWYQHSPT
jgi:hypothetical protein